ncbi:MAG: hypothetical protein WAM44_03800, partial [Chthoniobacterales bacterium]
MSASTYLHGSWALVASRCDPWCCFIGFGHRKNQIFFLFLPVKKYGFCSRGTVVLITQWGKP